MTNDELQAHIAAINAAVMNEEVEYHYAVDGWDVITTKPFINATKLRIKPQPREVWVIGGDKRSTMFMCAYTRSTAENFAAGAGYPIVGKFREVIE